ncbi:MAG TPA: protein kinase [Aggregatilineaceae bacterium]|nr:protein kinase [Aggregatilineaceae bacterium]
MSADPLIGKKLGDYTIQDLLGRGGMSRVYRGYDENLDRYAAVKVISGDFATTTEEEYTRRFQIEARSIAHLRHPNIVGIYQFGRSEGIYYMAQVFLEGQDLRTLLKNYADQKQRMSITEILRIVGDIASALDYAHEQGVIHRDVKPSNIMLERRTGRAILMDFGLALSVNEGTMGDTFGSAHYIAPEQAISSAKAVPQSDLYSLGIVLYEMLTGKVPFDDPSVMSVALKHLNELPPPPSMYNPNLPASAETVILKTLDKDPGRRFKTGKELVTTLHKAFEEDSQKHFAPNAAVPSVIDILESKPALPSRPRDFVLTTSTASKPSAYDATPAPMSPELEPGGIAGKFARRKARKDEAAALKSAGEGGLQIDSDTLNNILDSYQDPREIGLVGPDAKRISVAERPSIPQPAESQLVVERKPRSSRRGRLILLLLLVLIGAGAVYALTRGKEKEDGSDSGTVGTSEATATVEVAAALSTEEATTVADATREATPDATEATAEPEETVTNTPSATAKPSQTPTETIPVALATEEPSPTDAPTNTPTDEPTAAVESAATDAATAEVTEAGANPPNIRMVYNRTEIFVVNLSPDRMDISDLVFEQQRPDGTLLSYNANMWDQQNIAERTNEMLGGGGCYQLTTGSGTRLQKSTPDCPRFLGTFQTSVSSRYFWVSNEPDAVFTVQRSGDTTPLATCAIAAGACEFYLPVPTE